MILEPALLQVTLALDSGSAVGTMEVAGVLDLVLEVVAVLDQEGLVQVADLLDPGFELVDHGIIEVVVLDPHSVALDFLEVVAVLDQEGLVEVAAALDLVLEMVAVLDQEGLVEVAAALDLVLELVAVLDQEGLVEVVAVLDLVLKVVAVPD